LGGNRGRLVDKETRSKVQTLIEEACANGARKSKACELLGISIRSYERWKLPNGLVDKRSIVKRTPSNKLTPLERQEIISTSNLPCYCDLPPCKIVPKLADQGVYLASESSFYRVLREEKMLQHRGRSKPRQHHKPKALIAIKPNQVWSWDISYLKTHIAGMHFYLYMIVDIFSRKIVGWTIQHHENSEHATALMIQACSDEKISPNQIFLHSDNGSPMKGATLLTTLQSLGVVTSFSRPAVSNDNPYSEALFKTIKYVPFYPYNGFSSIEEARCWTEKFVNWYNNEHLHSALKFVTPHQRHTGQDLTILENRKKTYQIAKKRNPSRWSKNIRNWNLPSMVILNPDVKQLAA
jgi:transposase InsO family protein